VTSSLRPSVSLKQLFPSAQFVGADDIVCSACDSHPESPMQDWVFAAGVATWTQPDRDIVTAINHGAVAILTDQLLPSAVPQCIVHDVRDAYAKLSIAAAGKPCDRILTIGVIGTHGKTSAALTIASMIKQIGKSVAYHSSLGGSDGVQSGLQCESDADAMVLAEWLRSSAENGTPAAIIELTDDMLRSHACLGLEFDALVFTSLRKNQRSDALQTRYVEHSMVGLLDQLKSHGVVIYNADDARLNRWVARHQPEAIAYGLDAAADVSGRRMRSAPGEQSIMVTAGKCIAPITSKLLGDHNARHMLAAAAVGYSFGLELFETTRGIERLQRIPGRMQRVMADAPFQIYIDAADQADRLAMALHTLGRNGTPVTCVAEVPDAATPDQLAAYGRVLERAASRVILTQSRRSVRFGQKAVWQVLDGCEYPASVQIVPNRKSAIELALRQANSGEAVLLCGWGNGSWTNDQATKPMNDYEVAMELASQVAKAPRPAAEAASIHGLKIFPGRAA
jgi:UDP-N-acetylmuramoyl-L-alanyl-D-glutamate--2,6-diaminopimelate ligase